MITKRGSIGHAMEERVGSHAQGISYCPQDFLKKKDPGPPNPIKMKPGVQSVLDEGSMRNDRRSC